jgi:hypothetical protein
VNSTEDRTVDMENERDADIDEVVFGDLPLNDLEASRVLAVRVDDLAALCRTARDERDALQVALGDRRGYSVATPRLVELTVDQLRLQVLMAEAEVLRLQQFEQPCTKPGICTCACGKPFLLMEGGSN